MQSADLFRHPASRLLQHHKIRRRSGTHPRESNDPRANSRDHCPVADLHKQNTTCISTVVIRRHPPNSTLTASTSSTQQQSTSSILRARREEARCQAVSPARAHRRSVTARKCALLVLHMHTCDATALLGLAGGTCGRRAATAARAHGDREENLYRILISGGLVVAACILLRVRCWFGSGGAIRESLVYWCWYYSPNHSWSLSIGANYTAMSWECRRRQAVDDQRAWERARGWLLARAFARICCLSKRSKLRSGVVSRAGAPLEPNKLPPHHTTRFRSHHVRFLPSKPSTHTYTRAQKKKIPHARHPSLLARISLVYPS